MRAVALSLLLVMPACAERTGKPGTSSTPSTRSEPSGASAASPNGWPILGDQLLDEPAGVARVTLGSVGGLRRIMLTPSPLRVELTEVVLHFADGTVAAVETNLIGADKRSQIFAVPEMAVLESVEVRYDRRGLEPEARVTISGETTAEP